MHTCETIESTSDYTSSRHIVALNSNENTVFEDSGYVSCTWYTATGAPRSFRIFNCKQRMSEKEDVMFYEAFEILMVYYFHLVKLYQFS